MKTIYYATYAFVAAIITSMFLLSLTNVVVKEPTFQQPEIATIQENEDAADYTARLQAAQQAAGETYQQDLSDYQNKSSWMRWILAALSLGVAIVVGRLFLELGAGLALSSLITAGFITSPNLASPLNPNVGVSETNQLIGTAIFWIVAMAGGVLIARYRLQSKDEII